MNENKRSFDMSQRSTPLILASQSFIRKKLLTDAGVDFEVQSADIDEGAVRSDMKNHTGPLEAAFQLASAKAMAINTKGWVIGADQILTCEGQWYAKPHSIEEASKHLRQLRGKTHILYTSVVIARDKNVTWHHKSKSYLTMRAFSDAFLDEYLFMEKDILSSVGCYKLEGRGIQLFSEIKGNYTDILGLPLLPLLSFLRTQKLLHE